MIYKLNSNYNEIFFKFITESILERDTMVTHVDVPLTS